MGNSYPACFEGDIMKTLSIDIETYSDVNLSKCGVYKYAESPDFEILLFGYSADGSEVTVIDLAQGKLPLQACHSHRIYHRESSFYFVILLL